MCINERLKRRIYKTCLEHLDDVSTRHKHFSFLCERNRIITFGYNKKTKTHPDMSKFNYKRYMGIHSELDALVKLKSNLCNAYLVNVRMNKQGRFMLSKPCPCCTRMLIARGVTKVFYSGTDQKFHSLRLPDLISY